MFFSEGPKMLDFTIRIDSTPTFFYVDNLYLNIAYAAHYVYFTCYTIRPVLRATYVGRWSQIRFAKYPEFG